MKNPKSPLTAGKNALNEDFILMLGKLPLLEYTSSLFSGQSLSNCYIICAQHLLETTRHLFLKFFELGLKRENLSVIGKCYSTNPLIYEILVADGVDVCPSSCFFDPRISFDSQYKKNIKKFIDSRIFKFSQYEKVIIIDDGGHILEYIQKSGYNKSNIRGVEQTSSGYYLIKKYALDFPVINVARSKAKLSLETPIIVDLAIDLTFQKIADYKISVKNILILGNGVIGNALVEKLQHHFNVLALDQDDFQSLVCEQGIGAVLEEIDLIFGCSGSISLPEAWHRFLKPNTVLASVSSSDREFDVASKRKRHGHVTSCHDDLYIDDIHILNCGFPVNFCDQYWRVDGESFQLTRSLLFAATLQSITSQDNGIINLAPDVEENIIEKHQELLGKKYKKFTEFESKKR